jgi:hypothetical protein
MISTAAASAASAGIRTSRFAAFARVGVDRRADRLWSLRNVGTVGTRPTPGARAIGLDAPALETTIQNCTAPSPGVLACPALASGLVGELTLLSQ